MSELIHTYSTLIQGEGGMTYRVSAHGARRDDGMWIGWLEFKPTKVDAPAFRTEWETTQPNRDALVYWASGLEPVYLEGALERIRSVAEG